MGAHRRGLLGCLRSFARQENGLVTVEWVAISGALVFGAIGLVWMTMNGLHSAGSAIGTNMGSCQQMAHQGNRGAIAACMVAQNGANGQPHSGGNGGNGNNNGNGNH